MRIFFAVPLPDTVKTACFEAQSALKAEEPVAWANAEQLHITLKFIAQFPEEDYPKLCVAAEDALQRLPVFDCSLGAFDAFPSMVKPKVFWIGVEDGAESLAALARAVESSAHSVGVPVETKIFQPHITLGRVRRGRHVVRLPLERAAAPLNALRQQRWSVAEVILYQSRLLSRGAEHIPLESFKLRS